MKPVIIMGMFGGLAGLAMIGVGCYGFLNDLNTWGGPILGGLFCLGISAAIVENQ